MEATRPMKLLFLLFAESIRFAFHALVVNKLRTILSLLGVTIGIFAIISVFTIVDSLERSIRTSVQSLGDNVIYVQKWPWSGGSDYSWWKYFKRPLPEYEEADKIRARSNYAEAVCFGASTGTNVQYKSNVVEEAGVFGVEYSYKDIWNFDIVNGRYFTESETKSGVNYCIVGWEIAENLFPSEDPVGKEIKVQGRKVVVIGVFEKEGTTLIGNSRDELVVVPYLYLAKIANVRSENSGPMVMVKAKPDITADQLNEELRGIMRSIRRLAPRVEDDFALNQISLLSQGLQMTFGVLNIAGWIIGGFSILVGGFGIANIMFVSVKERTNQIGIQKALGAKNFFIMLQFLFESVALCVMGGIVGLALVFGLSYFVTQSLDFDIMLSMGNIVLGLAISVAIGLISGFVPANAAALMDPVDAIRSGQ
jgi:putative ABC transport system permease protein